eukprot:1152093-Pelagomonas_calceolata.AAC.2
MIEDETRNVAAPSSPYIGKQDKAFCLVHSFNMALSRHVFSGHDVLFHIRHMRNTLQSRNLEFLLSNNSSPCKEETNRPHDQATGKGGLGKY